MHPQALFHELRGPPLISCRNIAASPRSASWLACVRGGKEKDPPADVTLWFHAKEGILPSQKRNRNHRRPVSASIPETEDRKEEEKKKRGKKEKEKKRGGGLAVDQRIPLTAISRFQVGGFFAGKSDELVWGLCLRPRCREGGRGGKERGGRGFAAEPALRSAPQNALVHKQGSSRWRGSGFVRLLCLLSLFLVRLRKGGGGRGEKEGGKDST